MVTAGSGAAEREWAVAIRFCRSLVAAAGMIAAWQGLLRA
jgi:hypothetical protein